VRRVRVAILFGGPGEEHPVSVKSAQEVARSLDPEKHEPIWIGITKDGAWQLCAGPATDWERADARSVVLSPDRTVGGLLVLDGDRYETLPVDVVLPLLHGRYGEDGSVQGLLELAGIPYVGCEVESSVLCMDKALTYLVAAGAGIATPSYRVLRANERVDPGAPAYPVVVKPARSGSSFGVTRVEGPDDLAEAIAAAREYDDTVLVEEVVVGREVGCAVLGERFGLVVGEVDQITLSHGVFRIHQEVSPESGSENATVVVPADIPTGARALVQETAKTLYRALGCKGLARVDLFLREDGTVVLNEVNTMPGMTSYSRYPRMMAAAGLPMSELVDRLVALTLCGKRR
jgi:D-alanine--(R)-lactate ligase